MKNETNKDGGGKGQWSAWKVSFLEYCSRPCTDNTQASKLAKEYEAKGGSYENESGSKNEPEKGTPKPKSDAKKGKEVKDSGKKKDAEEKEAQEKSDKEDEPKEEKKANDKKARVSTLGSCMCFPY